jgi:beta-glucosidase
VKTGTDLDCGRVYRNLTEAVKLGLITEAELDVSLKRLFTARMRLGMFDPADRVAYARIPFSILDQPSHKALAREVARESMVLLKNANNTLPLRKDLGTVAVIGPNADQWLMLLGNYNGVPSETITPLEGIRRAVGQRTKVLYARGSELADGFPTFGVVPGEALRGTDGQPGLRVEYFSNRDLNGAPLYTGRDSTLDANWSDTAPRSGMDDDDFGVRWSGVITPRYSGTYNLGAMGTTKFEVFLADTLLARSQYNYRDEFGDPRVVAAALPLDAGKSYPIRIEAHESYGDAQLQLVWAEPTPALTSEAVATARQADAVVLVLGLTPRLEGEEMRVSMDGFRGGDRTTLGLPPAQEKLLQDVMAVGKPTVLVLLNGSAVAINWAHDNVPAILEAWYPGQAAGTAIADVLFGDYNPAGRLPVTFYRSADDLPPFEDYDMKGRTYRFFEGTPLYPFGHGLSYTTFGYSNLRTSTETLAADGTVNVSVDVRNTGTRPGDEVVQLYARHEGSAVARARRDLRGFKRIMLAPGQSRTVTFPVKASELAFWDADADRWVVERDRVVFEVGASSADIRASRAIQVNGEARTR